jgi:hypothetical protein
MHSASAAIDKLDNAGALTASVETDVHWPLSPLDLETEQLWCLPHGNEMPCPRCNRKEERVMV